MKYTKVRPSTWQRSKTWSPSSPQIHQKYIYIWNNSYRTPTERRQKTSNFPKGKKLPTYLGREKEKRKRKHRDKRIRTGPATLGEAVKEETLPHTRKPLRRQRRGGGGGGGKLQSHKGDCSSNRGAERKAERFPHRESVLTSTHQPERLVCSDGWGWGLRLGLRRSDPRERTGVGCVNTAWKGLLRHS